MKVGDLVTLSSSGARNEANHLVAVYTPTGEAYGMVLEHDEDEYYPYQVQWFGLTEYLYEWGKEGTHGRTMRFKRYELKHYKQRSK